MPADDRQQRYDAILRKIANRQAAAPSPQTPQDRALAALNASDSLAALAKREYPRILCYGPQSIRAAAWSGILIWHHQKGYYGYRQLHLLGIWAHYVNAELTLSAAIRPLDYQAPLYSPDAYHATIKRGFQLYYGDRGAPPAENDRLLYQAAYQASQRLHHRRELTRVLRDWQREAGG